jgi:hypothetical protein
MSLSVTKPLLVSAVMGSMPRERSDIGILEQTGLGYFVGPVNGRWVWVKQNLMRLEMDELEAIYTGLGGS